MTPSLDIQSAMMAAKAAPLTPPKPTNNLAVAKNAAQQFTGIFVSEFLGNMFEGISTDGPFGGGPGESMFRSLMLDEYGKQIAAQGGFGLSAAITRQLLKTQEGNA